MDTTSTNAKATKSRKRAPRNTNPIDEPPAVTPVDELPMAAPADPSAERIANLRQMLRDEGLDPDVVFANQLTVDTTPPKTVLVEGTEPGTPINKAETIGEPTIQPNGLINATVDFRDRKIEVMAPEIEQVMVIRRMQSLFANAAKMKEITADEAIRLMDRALKAVCSVVVNPDDVEFLEDLLLTRQAKIEDTLPLLRESLQALERANAGNGNRADRRKAAKSSGRTGRAELVTASE